MLAGSESDLQRMMDSLNMVSVNYNMKINTKKTKVLRVSKGSESDNEDSSCSGNYGTSQGILLLRKHDIRLCHREIKRKIATAASIWFEIWGVVDPGKKNFDFYRQISQKFQSFQAILQKNIEFCRQISENFDSFRQLKKFYFPSTKLSIYSYLWANYSISLQD